MIPLGPAGRREGRKVMIAEITFPSFKLNTLEEEEGWLVSAVLDKLSGLIQVGCRH